MKRDVNYYLSKGLDKKAAEYFANGRKKITAVVANDDYTLTITFNNEEKRCYNVRPLIKAGGVFKHIENIKDFKRVYLDDCACVAWDIDPNINSQTHWENKIDLCKDACYLNSVPLRSKQTEK